MFAVIRTGGKQYKVAKDTYLHVEKLDANVGDKIQIGGDVLIEILPKIHPKAIPAQSVRIGIEAGKHIVIDRGEKSTIPGFQPVKIFTE